MNWSTEALLAFSPSRHISRTLTTAMRRAVSAAVAADADARGRFRAVAVRVEGASASRSGGIGRQNGIGHGNGGRSPRRIGGVRGPERWRTPTTSRSASCPAFAVTFVGGDGP